MLVVVICLLDANLIFGVATSNSIAALVPLIKPIFTIVFTFYEKVVETMTLLLSLSALTSQFSLRLLNDLMRVLDRDARGSERF